MIHPLVFYANLVSLMVLAGVITYRRLYREFPFFFAYVMAVILAELIRRSVYEIYERHSLHAPYFYTYWITEALLVLLGFLVLYEVFLIHLFPGFNITRIYRWMFPVVAFIIVGLTVWLFVAAPSTGPSKIVTVVGASTTALNFCQVTFLIFFGGLMWYMSREWRRHELGIASGFAFHASVKLLATGRWVANSYIPTKIYQLPTISYLIAILIWLFFLSKSDPEPQETLITEEMAAEADRAYQDIVHLIRGKPKR